jgi:hypothetical protein
LKPFLEISCRGLPPWRGAEAPKNVHEHSDFNTVDN